MISYEEATKLLSYDADTGELRRRVSRGRVRAGSVTGWVEPNGYVRVMALGRLYLAHRLAWLLTYGVWPSDQIDHVNGNRSDNRLANLRECTNAENQQNRGAKRNNTSGFVGVTWDARKAKWKAQIMAQGKSRHIGYFAAPEQAHEAYLAAKVDLHDFQPTPRAMLPRG